MTGFLIVAVYAALFVGSMVLVNLITAKSRPRDYTSLKTVTFGDESAVRPNRWASVISVLVLFLIWGAFTGSKYSPIHVPGPFEGDNARVLVPLAARQAAADHAQDDWPDPSHQGRLLRSACRTTACVATSGHLTIPA